MLKIARGRELTGSSIKVGNLIVEPSATVRGLRFEMLIRRFGLGAGRVTFAPGEIVVIDQDGERQQVSLRRRRQAFEIRFVVLGFSAALLAGLALHFVEKLNGPAAKGDSI